MIRLKITRIGDAVGVILSRELLAKLQVDRGDELYAVETSHGIELMRCDPEGARQIELAEKIMREDRDVLSKLAE